MARDLGIPGIPVAGPGIPDVGVLAPDFGRARDDDEGVLIPDDGVLIPVPLLLPDFDNELVERAISPGGLVDRFVAAVLLVVLTELTLVDELARLGMDDVPLARFGSSLLWIVGGATGTGSFFRPNVFLKPPFRPSFGDNTAPPVAPSSLGAVGSLVVGDAGCGVDPDFGVLLLEVDEAFLLLSLSLNSLNLSNIDFWLVAAGPVLAAAGLELAEFNTGKFEPLKFDEPKFDTGKFDDAPELNPPAFNGPELVTFADEAEEPRLGGGGTEPLERGVRGSVEDWLREPGPGRREEEVLQGMPEEEGDAEREVAGSEPRELAERRPETL